VYAPHTKCCPSSPADQDGAADTRPSLSNPVTFPWYPHTHTKCCPSAQQAAGATDPYTLHLAPQASGHSIIQQVRTPQFTAPQAQNSSAASTASAGAWAEHTYLTPTLESRWKRSTATGHGTVHGRTLPAPNPCPIRVAHAATQQRPQRPCPNPATPGKRKPRAPLLGAHAPHVTVRGQFRQKGADSTRQ